MKRRLCSLIMTVVMLLSLLPVTVGAADESSTSGGITWSITDDTLTISPAESPESGYQSGEMKDYESGSSMPWSTQKESISAVVIQDDVKNLGDRAFMGCSALTNVQIPDSVTEYGTNCFHSCTSLTSLNIGKNVTSVGQIGIYLDSAMGTLTVDEENSNYAVDAND